MLNFVGRSAELEELLAAFADAEAGRGRAVFLTGEPGIGKTRLADELCARLGDRAHVLWGRCWEAGGAPAFWPWIEILRPLVAEADPALLAVTLGADAESLAVLVPEIRARAGASPSPEQVEPSVSYAAAALRADWPTEYARFSLFDATLRFIRAVATMRPLLLVLDDLHAADEPSLRLLEFVARGLRGTHALIVGTYREADATLGTDKAALLATIGREAHRITLRRLRDHEVAQLLESVSGVTPSNEVVAAVLGATEGTPLYVSEVVSVAAQQGLPPVSAQTGAVVVPNGLGAAIRGHLGRVSDGTRAVLGPAAVIGRDFELSVLSALPTLEGLSANHLADRLDEGVRAGVIVDLHEQPARFRFSHILIRETLYRDLGSSARERLHFAVGRLLLAAAPTRNREAEIAHHFLHAGGQAHWDAMVHARRAGEHALELLAHEQAVAHFRQALGALAAAGSAPSRDHVELLIALSEAHGCAGDRARANQASEQAARHAADLGDAELLARAALRRGAEFTIGFVDPTLVELLERAHSAVGEDSALGARVLARLAAARQPAPDPEQPLELARRAIALARDLGDKQTLAAVLRDARSAYLPLDSLDQRIELDLETLTLAEQAGDHIAALHAHRRLTMDRLEEGDTATASAHIERFERIVDEIRQPHRKWWSLGARAGIETLKGQFDRGGALLEEAEQLAHTSNEPSVRGFLGFQRLVWIWTSRRDQWLARADAELARAHAEHPSPMLELYRALVHARMGDTAYVKSAWKGIDGYDIHPRFSGQGPLAEVAIIAGDRDAMAVLYERLLPWAERYGVHLGFEGCQSRPLGVLAHALGRIDDARRHFETAIALDERIGARPLVAHDLVAYARMLAECGGDADRGRASSLFERAAQIGEELAMPGILTDVRAQQRPSAAPARADVPTVKHPLSESFRLEGEYWTVSFGDQSYRLRDNKGLQLVAYLVNNPGRDFHVLHLAGVADGNAGGGELIEAPASTTPDAAARAAYKTRLEDLRRELDEADANADQGRSERLREEIELLSEEVARGLGLGGREHGTGGSVERARVNVQRRISDALKKIEAACPALGQHLSRAIRTGTYCSYVAAI